MEEVRFGFIDDLQALNIDKKVQNDTGLEVLERNLLTLVELVDRLSYINKELKQVLKVKGRNDNG
jgi:hypothetical protein